MMSSTNTKLMTVSEAAKKMRVSGRSIRRWAHTGVLRAIRMGRGYRFEKGVIEQARKKGLVLNRSAEASGSTMATA